MKVLTPGHKYELKDYGKGPLIIEFAEISVGENDEFSCSKTGITDSELIKVVSDRVEYLRKSLGDLKESIHLMGNALILFQYNSRALTMYQYMASILTKKRAEMVEAYKEETDKITNNIKDRL